MSDRVALYVGSFDPVTLGHLDIVQRACQLFDRVIVAVAHNAEKNALFSPSQRVALLQLALADYDSVHVTSFEGLTVDFANQHQINVLIRGLRSGADFEQEKPLAQMNHAVSFSAIETVFLATTPMHAAVSSSLVRELIRHRAFDRLAPFLPASVIEFITASDS